MRVNGARLLATLAGPRAHLARSGAGRQGRTFGRIEHRGLEVRGLVRRIEAVEIGDAGRRKGRDQHGGPMMRTIQVWLGERIRCFFRGFLMFVLMMPRMRGLSLGGFVTAILRHRCERDLQRKKAKKKNEKQTFHLAAKSNIDPFRRQNFGRKPVDQQVADLGNASGAVVSQRFNDRASDPSATGATLRNQIL